eukprot:GHVU01159878.1.p4 GENE.GHVU01159878.1~~GHVU01159878.1.p4  ORF type:complete len:116 (+),score=19.59 GHVU01159878.1:512-859(+)
MYCCVAVCIAQIGGRSLLWYTLVLGTAAALLRGVGGSGPAGGRSVCDAESTSYHPPALGGGGGGGANQSGKQRSSGGQRRASGGGSSTCRMGLEDGDRNSTSAYYSSLMKVRPSR